MYCSIQKWISDEDENLADSIRDLCMVSQLTAREGSRGVTFLYPSEAVRKEIRSASRSDTPQRAIDLIQAHIVPAFMGSSAAFTPGMGTKARVQLGVENVEGGAVKLANGAVLKPAPSFKALNRDNIAVWLVSKGEVPLTGEPFDIASLRVSKPKTGGRDGGGGAGLRASIMDKIEKEYSSKIENKDAHPDNVFTENLMGLMDCMADPSHDFEDDLVKALCVLDPNPLCLYLLVEPGRSGGHFISDAAIEAWGGNKFSGAPPALVKLHANPMKTMVAASTGDAASASIFTNPRGVWDAACARRDELLQNPSVNSPAAITALYKNVVEANKIGNVKNVWPPAVALAFKDGRKLWQDVFRNCLRIFSITAQDRGGYFANFSTLVHETFRGESYASDISNYWDTSRMNNAAEVHTALGFLNSSDFLYFPRDVDTLEAVQPGEIGDVDSAPHSAPAFRGDCLSMRQLRGACANDKQSGAGIKRIT